MDRVAVVNRERWNALAEANVQYSQPFFEYTVEQAREHVSHCGILTDVAGKDVLCLASGGGQDSVAFGLLGAHVTVFDLSDVQLERDRAAAQRHGLEVTLVQGDMRDLTNLSDNSFDIVWQPYSLNYSPTVEQVFCEVVRVLRPRGIYRVTFANPFAMALANDWEKHGYPLRGLYLDGEDILHYVPLWEITTAEGATVKLDGPHQFRHNLSTVLNTLVGCGFRLLQLREWMVDNPDPQPGSWAHFTQAAPPWFDSFWQLNDDGLI